MNRFLMIVAIGAILVACRQNNHTTDNPKSSQDIFELSDLYASPEIKMMYSEFVSDSFKIFSSIPQKNNQDTLAAYPLILILDANGYFESVLAEFKLATLTQDLPKSIVVGIGYKDFPTMDSLRDRDYTYPVALPEDSFRISGGAQNFKKFINQELLPNLLKEYHINQNKIVLLGHSLGGYFILYYMLDSLEKGDSKITNFISASPSLSYHNRYLLGLEMKLGASLNKLPANLYVSVGSLERDSLQKDNVFLDFKTQMETRHHKGDRMKIVEYGNFDHMDAAMPGLMKGLVFVFEK